jgi:RimJ/RimL family protein N-acetyltransferase
MEVAPQLPDNLSLSVLTDHTLASAYVFEALMVNDGMFTFFRHTRPSDMLDMRRWRVWLVLDTTRKYPDTCVAWGHAQLGEGHKGHVARLGIAVLPAYRGKGLGTMLVAKLLRETTDTEKHVATVFADNPASLAVFRKHGFVEEGTFVDEERWPGKGSRDVISLAKRRPVTSPA